MKVMDGGADDGLTGGKGDWCFGLVRRGIDVTPHLQCSAWLFPPIIFQLLARGGGASGWRQPRRFLGQAEQRRDGGRERAESEQESESVLWKPAVQDSVPPDLLRSLLFSLLSPFHRLLSHQLIDFYCLCSTFLLLNPLHFSLIWQMEWETVSVPALPGSSPRLPSHGHPCILQVGYVMLGMPKN